MPFPSPGDLPNPEIEPGSPALQADSLPTELQGKPSRLVITFLPRSKRLLISWLQSPFAVIWEHPQKIKSNTASTVSPSISHEVMGTET